MTGNLIKILEIIENFKNAKKLSAVDRNLFLEYYYKNDSLALQLMTKFTQALAFIIFNINQSFAPEYIYLQSRIVGEIPELLDNIKAVYRSLANDKDPHLKLSPMIETAPLYGGAAMLTHQILNLENFDLYLLN